MDELECPPEFEVRQAFMRWAVYSGLVGFNEVFSSRNGRADIILLMPYFQFYLVECKSAVVARDVKQILIQLQRYSEALGRVVGMGLAVHEQSITPLASKSLSSFNIQIIRIPKLWFTAEASPKADAFYPIIRSSNLKEQ